MCSSQDARGLEFDITVAIRKAKKLKWMMSVKEMETKRQDMMRQVEEQLKKVKDQVEARKHIENLRTVVLGNLSQKKSDIPEYFICPLTQTLLVDPIINEFGHTYEKKQYMAYAAAKNKDPISGSALTKNIMYDNIAVKNAIEYYLQENIWAFDFREGQTIDDIHF
jgi:hydroxypyruvate isomerase